MPARRVMLAKLEVATVPGTACPSPSRSSRCSWRGVPDPVVTGFPMSRRVSIFGQAKPTAGSSTSRARSVVIACSWSRASRELHQTGSHLHFQLHQPIDLSQSLKPSLFSADVGSICEFLRPLERTLRILGCRSYFYKQKSREPMPRLSINLKI